MFRALNLHVSWFWGPKVATMPEETTATLGLNCSSHQSSSHSRSTAIRAAVSMIVLSNTTAWLDGHRTSQNDASVKNWTDLVD